ncbi:hypothetical protein [Sphingobium sp. B2]|uniref:hypothetical protein n=1 Tax=Sphingobium sp. B2 TaxID=2583228 RepID=UPI0011A6B340|nr:hypothetical protein [Sphingobium sp. B2]
MRIGFWISFAISIAALLIAGNELLTVFHNAPQYETFQADPFPAYSFLFVVCLLAPIAGFKCAKEGALKVAIALCLASTPLLIYTCLHVSNAVERA